MVNTMKHTSLISILCLLLLSSISVLSIGVDKIQIDETDMISPIKTSYGPTLINPFNTSNPDEPMALIFSDNFDSESDGDSPPVNWDNDTSFPLTSLEVDNAQYVSSPNSVYIRSSSYGYAHHDISAGTTEFAEVEIYAQTTGENIGFILQSTEGDVNSANQGALILFQPDGWIDYYSGGYIPICTYSAGWNKIKIVPDYVNDDFDFYLDDVLKSSNLPFRNDIDTCKGIHLFINSAGANDDCWYDNIQVGDSADSTAPEFNSFTYWPTNRIQDYGGNMNISANITDASALTINMNITYPNATWWTNASMINVDDDYYINTTYSYAGWYNYTIWAVDSASNTNSSSGSFNISDVISVTFISQTPIDINITSTGNISILYNITTHNTPINASSIVFAHSVNHTDDNTRNSSFHIPIDVNQPDGLRSHGRGNGGWYEIFNSTGTGEIGYPGEWMAMTIDDPELSIEASGYNWTLINFTANTPHLFSSIWYVDRFSLTNETKTDQYIEIYGKHSVRNWFNMSSTEFPIYHKDNKIIRIGFYAEPDGSPDPLIVYLANDSYISGNPSISSYAVPIGQILNTDDYSHYMEKSSYYTLTFSTNNSGYVSNLYLTDNFSFIFVGGLNPTNVWKIYWADDNATHDGYYHNLNNTWFQYTSLNSWTSWTWRNGTIDCHIHFFNLEGNDTIEYKAYAQDVWMGLGNGSWSTDRIDIINETALPPNTPFLIIPNGTAPTDSYILGETINITYSWIGDPNNNDMFWNNITCHNSTGDIVFWVNNRTVYDSEIFNDSKWYFNWTPGSSLSFGTGYYINITITDDTNLSTYGVQNGTFSYLPGPPGEELGSSSGVVTIRYVDFEFFVRSGRLVQFNYTGNMGDVIKYRWYFGDGIGKDTIESKILHEYELTPSISRTDIFNVTLEVWTEDGRYSSKTQTLDLTTKFFDKETGSFVLGPFIYPLYLLMISGFGLIVVGMFEFQLSIFEPGLFTVVGTIMFIVGLGFALINFGIIDIEPILEYVNGLTGVII